MIAAVSILSIGAMAQVHLRSGEATPAGEIISADAQGIVLGPPPGTLVIGWDRVKSVDGAWAERCAPFLPAAEQAWRARTRLERGDPLSAEPLFEKLFVQYRGKQGPTASVIAEGLMRCRLRRAAHVAAIDPWLAMIVAAPAVGTAVPALHPAWASEAGMAPSMDPAKGLVPALPPIWLAWPSVEAFARQNSAEALKDPRAAALASLYEVSAKFECGQAVQTPGPAMNDPGVQIVRDIVVARVGDADQRAAARKSLEDRMKSSAANPVPPWLEAWCRAAIGRSLLRETASEQKKLGVVELLNIPARFGAMHPYLAGIALAESSVALRGAGDSAGADVLARELMERYPSHPVLDWPLFRAAAPARSAVTNKAAEVRPSEARPAETRPAEPARTPESPTPPQNAVPK